ncbi:MAG: hypothetical protein HY717_10530 [Planctomycetes bacterium]|nr:hypothetical protein [Planctomycetota bacterium]
MTAAVEAPQDLALDGSDGSLWITSAIGGRILHYSARLEYVGSLPAPFEVSKELSGIAWRSRTDTLLVLNPVLGEVQEIHKDGSLTDLRFALPLFTVAGLDPHPFPQGLAYLPESGQDQETIWVLEPRFGAVYRIDLNGLLLNWFCHPSYPKACDPAKANAIPATCLDLRLGKKGEFLGLDLGSGSERVDSIIGVDPEGRPLGIRIPVLEAGGTIGGMARGLWSDPASGELRPIAYFTVQSSAEILAIDASEPPVREILDLQCAASQEKVSLSWRNGEEYAQEIKIFRDGALLESLPGSENAYLDADAPVGIHLYRVQGDNGAGTASSECRVVIGAGQVIRQARFEGKIAVAMAEDARGNLYVTDLENRIFIYDKNLLLLDEVPSPFIDPGDRLSGIAFNPPEESLLVYNFGSNLVAEITLEGELIQPPFASGLQPRGPDPEDEPAAGAMLFNPQGNGGRGSFLYYEMLTAEVRELSREGGLLSRCPHPDSLRDPEPADSPLITFASGMTPVPGSFFRQLDLPGGSARDGQITRILRLEAGACRPTGFEIPMAGIEAAAGGSAIYQMGIHDSLHNGRPVSYVLKTLPTPSLLFEVSREEPPLLAPTDFSCRQEDLDDHVHITFSGHGPYHALELWRDGALLAALPAEAADYLDASAPPGAHRYRLKVRRGAVAAESRECSLQVGTGAILARAFTYPGTLFTALARDPADGSFLCASSANRISGKLFRYRSDLSFAEERPAAFAAPFQTAGLAYRRDPVGKKWLYSLGWNPAKSPGEQNRFPIRVQDESGAVAAELFTDLPVTSSLFVSYPAGLAWDSSDDTFWYLERNTRTIIHLDLEGRVLEHFPNPAHPHQDGVFNYGLWADGERGLLYLAGAGRRDFQITRIVELTRAGLPTGFEIPLDRDFYREHAGFALETSTAVAQSRRGSASDLVRLKIFEDLPAPLGFAAEAAGREVRLSWRGDRRWRSLELWRGLGGGGKVIAALPGEAASFLDAELPLNSRATYVLRPRTAPGSGPAAALTLTAARTFRRGDVEEDRELDITDAIAVLEYLFLGRRQPACLDAADVDDNGAVEITDAIVLLTYLFIAGDPPAPPFPNAGLDPSFDGLDCDFLLEPP